MNRIEIIRTFQDDKETIGNNSRIAGDKGETIFSFISIERADKNNEHGDSCIPAGRYFWSRCLATNNIPYEHLFLNNVPGRDGICVHAGNYFFDSKGCILVGVSLADINRDGENDIIASKQTLKTILSLLPEEGIIDIIENFILA